MDLSSNYQVSFQQIHAVLSDLGSGSLETHLNKKSSAITQLANAVLKKESVQEIKETAKNIELIASTLTNEIDKEDHLNALKNEVHIALKKISTRRFKTPEKSEALQKIKEGLEGIEALVMKEKAKRHNDFLVDGQSPAYAQVSTEKNLSQAERILGKRRKLTEEEKKGLEDVLKHPEFAEQFKYALNRIPAVRKKNLELLGSGEIPTLKHSWNKNLNLSLHELKSLAKNIAAAYVDEPIDISSVLNDLFETAFPDGDQMVEDTMSIGILGNVFTDVLPSLEETLQFRDNPKEFFPPDPERMGVDTRYWKSYYVNKSLLAHGYFEDPERANYHQRGASPSLQRSTWYSVEESKDHAFISGIRTIGIQTATGVKKEFDVTLNLKSLGDLTYKQSHAVMKFILTLYKSFDNNASWVTEMKLKGETTFPFPLPESDNEKLLNDLKEFLPEEKVSELLQIAATFVYDIKHKYVFAMLELDS